MVQRSVVYALLRAIALQQSDFWARLVAAHDFDVPDRSSSYMAIGRARLAIYAAAMALIFKTGALGRMNGYGCMTDLPQHSCVSLFLVKIFCHTFLHMHGNALHCKRKMHKWRRKDDAPGPVRPKGVNGSSDERCCQDALPDPEWRCRVLGWAKCRPELLPGSSKLLPVTPSWRAARPWAACTALRAAGHFKSGRDFLLHVCLQEVYLPHSFQHVKSSRSVTMKLCRSKLGYMNGPGHTIRSVDMYA